MTHVDLDALSEHITNRFRAQCDPRTTEDERADLADLDAQDEVLMDRLFAAQMAAESLVVDGWPPRSQGDTGEGQSHH